MSPDGVVFPTNVAVPFCPERQSPDRPRPERAIGPIVLACDAAYGMPLATAIRSIVEANSAYWPLEFYVLTNGLSERTRTRVVCSLPTDSALLRWISVDLERFQGYSTAPYISAMTYARLLIPRAFPESVSRVLYVDCDLLVLDDLAPLWCTDLQGAVVGAVLDGLDAQIKANKPGLETLPRVREYFNAGVLLIDLDRWRAERIAENALDYLIRHPQSRFSDQDALNVACDGRWRRLDVRWNFQGHLYQRIGDIAPNELPGIVHFIDSAKPWIPSSLSANAEFYDEFRRRTLFARSGSDIRWDTARRGWSLLKRRVRKSDLWNAVGGGRVRPRTSAPTVEPARHL
jgi:lipopolysaccharide biosynthesis glycosyltransferase